MRLARLRLAARSLRPLAWGSLLLAIVASAAPMRAQDAAPEATTAAPSAVSAREHSNQRIDRIRAERMRIIVRHAPNGFERWMRDLPPRDRRQISRKLHGMPEVKREEFFRNWSRMSVDDRRQLPDIFASTSEARRRRELPPHLRTPEMRARLEQMSPDERRAFFARAQDWHEMNAAERRSMRARLHKFGGMTEIEQQALVDEKFKRSSPEQRARILQQLREASRQQRALRAAPSASPEAAAPPTTDALPQD